MGSCIGIGFSNAFLLLVFRSFLNPNFSSNPPKFAASNIYGREEKNNYKESC